MSEVRRVRNLMERMWPEVERYFKEKVIKDLLENFKGYYFGNADERHAEEVVMHAENLGEDPERLAVEYIATIVSEFLYERIADHLSRDPESIADELYSVLRQKFLPRW